MSSVSLSASGSRSLSTTINDPAATRASMPTKTGDGIGISGGSFEEVRILLPASARIERIVQSSSDGKGGDRTMDSWQIVFPASGLTAFARPTETSWPHLSVDVRGYDKSKTDGLHYLERGEVAESYSLVDLGIAEVTEGEFGTSYALIGVKKK